MPEQRKRCTKCGVEKAVGEFYVRDGKPIAACKECTKAAVATYQAANPTKTADWGRNYRQRNARRESLRTAAWAKGPGRKKRQAIKRRSDARRVDARAREWADWYARNGEALRERQRAEYDPAKKRASRNPEKMRLDNERRRARLLAAYVEDTPFDDILQRDRGICGICGLAVMDPTPEIDHILPLAAGGTHEMKNVQLAHRACNRRKGSSLTYEP